LYTSTVAVDAETGSWSERWIMRITKVCATASLLPVSTMTRNTVVVRRTSLIGVKGTGRDE
ncbi:MAG: hypothetical protein J7L57_07585, partial [Deltaproteobacteria bacterium]|nr:hypothetical protein [Candidatus Tharpella sp.]